MLDQLIRICAAVGILTFGLRGVLVELGVPGWGPMSSFVLAALIVYGAQYLARITHHPRHLPKMLDDHLRNAEGGERALSA
jgi:hypothetical protein